ncbi:MAG: plastocyanin/azurin family copper-binding protein [Gemmatimonadota bacterium]|nr:plastocyanin/azurin family copper-binding protein [Gemmatimonadota bacterium]
MRIACMVLPAVFALACDGDNGGGPAAVATSVDIALSGGGATLTAVGQTRTLTATVRDQNNQVMPSAPVAWTSSNTAIVTVNPASGAATTATAVANGNSTITAASGAADETVDLMVNTGPPPQVADVVATTGLTFNPRSVEVAVNGTVTWTFEILHNVTFEPGQAGAPANIPNTASGDVPRTFTQAGTFDYQCTLHSGMSGTVVVR